MTNTTAEHLVFIDEEAALVRRRREPPDEDESSRRLHRIIFVAFQGRVVIPLLDHLISGLALDAVKPQQIFLVFCVAVHILLPFRVFWSGDWETSGQGIRTTLRWVCSILFFVHGLSYLLQQSSILICTEKERNAIELAMLMLGTALLISSWSYVNVLRRDWETSLYVGFAIVCSFITIASYLCGAFK